MSIDLDAANYALSGLRPFPVAVTTIDGGEANGLISLSAGAASIVPEAPRATISLTKYNRTHDMVLSSGIFVVHLFAAEPVEALEESLAILKGLGGSSGRDGDKLARFRTKPGVTGAPILLDALCYVEARVVKTLDMDESTLFVGDVVGAERFGTGERLRIGEAWKRLPREWIEQYDANHVPQLASARRYRGLPERTAPRTDPTGVSGGVASILLGAPRTWATEPTSSPTEIPTSGDVLAGGREHGT